MRHVVRVIEAESYPSFTADVVTSIRKYRQLYGFKSDVSDSRRHQMAGRSMEMDATIFVYFALYS